MRVPDHLPLAVYRTVSCFDRKFRTPVAVQVIDHKLRVVRARTDVTSHVYTPHTRSVQLVGIEKNRSRKTAVRIILGIGRFPFQDDFQFSVSVKITDGSIIGRVSTSLSVRHHLLLRPLQRYIQITARRIGTKRKFSSARTGFTSVTYRTHLIRYSLPRRIIIIKLCGDSHRHRGNQPPVTIDVEYRFHCIGR